jgi:hypothetical protein
MPGVQVKCGVRQQRVPTADLNRLRSLKTPYRLGR